MKQGGFLLLGLMLFFLYSDIAAQVTDIEKYCQPYEHARCNDQKDPHCGSDGRTYINRCYFCTAYFSSSKTLRLKHLGEC
ncbi:ovomucoid-like [Candoia aspera]|uniref:ovomucoid-like n=1 Tax=Candoia aspera TaxID=51853 RepID=UPI002FD7D1DC